MSLNPKTKADEAQLISELLTTFPGLHVRPAAEWSPMYGCGVWIGGDTVVMPDGLPIFTDLTGQADEYDGFLHTGFEAWVALRGWYIESVDPFTHIVLPDPVIARSVDQLHNAWFAKPCAPLLPGELPF